MCTLSVVALVCACGLQGRRLLGQVWPRPACCLLLLAPRVLPGAFEPKGVATLNPKP